MFKLTALALCVLIVGVAAQTEHQLLTSDAMTIRELRIVLLGYKIPSLRPTGTSQRCCDLHLSPGTACPETCLAAMVVTCSGHRVGQLLRITLRQGIFDTTLEVLTNQPECFRERHIQVSLEGIPGEPPLLTWNLTNVEANVQATSLISRHESADSFLRYSITKLCSPFVGWACDKLCVATNVGQRCNPRTGDLECRAGYRGAPECLTVTTVATCTPNPCLNGAPCLVVDGSAVCNCPAGLSGQFCQNNQCGSHNCIHGVCSQGRSGCVCFKNFQGNNCDTPTCNDSLCNNRGRCVISGGKQTCICRPDLYWGARCEYGCDKLCLNGGVCINDNGKPICSCAFGFQGGRCQQSLTGTPSSVPTNNCASSGVLVEIDRVRYCECAAGFTGGYCEEVSCTAANCVNGVCFKNKCFCVTTATGRTCSEGTCVPGVSCENGGFCSVVNRASTLCQCSRQNTGNRCQYTCPVTCSEFGRCGLMNATLQCICDSLHEGDDCTLVKRDRLCRELDCQNGGVCEFGTENYVCRCPSGWQGDDCSQSTCTPGQCHHGVCFAGRGCFCTNNWVGVNCDQPTCSNEICNNRGFCGVTGQERQCICQRGFTGQHCEHQCPASCINGQCYLLNGELKCRCDPEFEGEACDFRNRDAVVTQFVMVVMLIVVILAVISFATIVLANLVFKRKKRQDLFNKGTIQEGLNLQQKVDPNLNWDQLK